jgi:prepilin-type N-terminal cleavage/methylation domain-containing protein
MQKQRGFTLIEIAIVLVIIGLLLGGILKGQELITSARVRNIITQQDGIKAAYYAFQDRFRALPGDYSGANAFANIRGIANATVGGDGNGVVQDVAANTETVLAWTHLSQAGFITGSYNATTATPAANATFAPTNPYNAIIQLQYDSVYQGAASDRTNLKTGNQIPVDILAEIDRKIDDGRADQGNFRFSAFNGGVAAPTAANCFTAATGAWNATTDQSNCGATSLF